MSGFGRTADVLELALGSSPSKCALHKAGCFIPLLLSFQLSFFLWTTLSLFLLFPSAFIFTSLIAHIGFSVIENAFSALRFSCLGRVLRGPFRAKSRQRRCVAECLLWVTSGPARLYHLNVCCRGQSGHRMSDWRAQKNPARGRALGFLVAGA